MWKWGERVEQICLGFVRGITHGSFRSTISKLVLFVWLSNCVPSLEFTLFDISRQNVQAWISLNSDLRRTPCVSTRLPIFSSLSFPYFSGEVVTWCDLCLLFQSDKNAPGNSTRQVRAFWRGLTFVWCLFGTIRFPSTYSPLPPSFRQMSTQLLSPVILLSNCHLFLSQLFISQM